MISKSEEELPKPTKTLDVLCVGHAAYDLIFSVPQHPGPDEKSVADSLIACGGGPAANAAIQVAKLGLQSAFAGYLANDLYGDKHLEELVDAGVNTECVVRGDSPTPLSAIIVKPDGKRALINYKGATKALSADVLDFSQIQPKVMLFDGHEPNISVPLAKAARKQGILTVLDAGSVHEGTLALMPLVDHLVCSEKFALQMHGDVHLALNRLAELADHVVITLGEHGLIWQCGEQAGVTEAFKVDAVDSTGAGDAFHGAYAAALALGLARDELLRYASAAGALCCTKMGARFGLAGKSAHSALLNREYRASSQSAEAG